MLSFVLIASGLTIASIALAVVARVPTYRAAPLFLVPLVWAMVALRRRLHLGPLHLLLLAIALLLHNLGALGLYQSGILGVSFDVYVHTWFGLVGALIVHRYLAHEWPSSQAAPWKLALTTLIVIMGFGGIHEVMEYGSYLLLGEERGMLKSTSYQFDTSRDLACNFVGCVVALALIGTRSRRIGAGGPDRAG